MVPPLDSLDPFLEVPDRQRDLTRVIRAVLFQARGLIVVFGDALTGRSLIATLARTFPVSKVFAPLIECEPTRLTLLPTEPARESEERGEFTQAQLLRSLLRQDPDGIFVSELDAEAAPILVTALFTGHLAVVGIRAESVREVFATLATEPQVGPEVERSLELAIEVRDGHIRALHRDGRVIAEATADGCTVHWRPPTRAPEPMRAPTLERPLQERRPSEATKRPSWVPITGSSDELRTALGTADALRPTGRDWPRCRTCGEALRHVLSLELDRLPELRGARPGVTQLFLCSAGCDTSNERAPGVLLEHVTDPLELLRSPRSEPVPVIEPGSIVRWAPFDDGSREDEQWPALRCDKLGGWPCFDPGADWPVDDDGAPLELLFQLAEGPPLSGGRREGWDDDRAEPVPGERPAPVLDPGCPRHVTTLLTGEAVVLLFHSPRTGRLALRWQSS